MSTTTDTSWQIERPLDDVRKLFTPGTRIRHRRPSQTHWEGVVTPSPQGRNRGQHVKIVQATTRPETIEVHIRWIRAGDTTPTPVQVTGWYPAKNLDPA